MSASSALPVLCFESLWLGNVQAAHGMREFLYEFQALQALSSSPLDYHSQCIYQAAPVDGDTVAVCVDEVWQHCAGVTLTLLVFCEAVYNIGVDSKVVCMRSHAPTNVQRHTADPGWVHDPIQQERTRPCPCVPGIASLPCLHLRNLFCQAHCRKSTTSAYCKGPRAVACRLQVHYSEGTDCVQRL